MLLHLRRFLHDVSGSVTIFFVLAFPLLLLIGGLATDAVLLNAQKRHVQSQADLAAQSAVRLLPDAGRARAVAQTVVSANAAYGPVTLGRGDVQFGSIAASGAFVLHANQDNPSGATVIRVTVPSAFSPLLLRPVLQDGNLVIRRNAYAAQKAVVVFTLRNRLLRVNTRESLLDPVFSGLGLALTVDALDYSGLAGARVRLDRLLGLATLGTGVQALSFNDVLKLPVTMPVLLGGLVSQGAMGAQALPKTAYAGSAVTLAEVMNVSPALLNARIGDVLPDVTVNAFDILSTFVGLAAKPTARVEATTGLDLSPLASVGISIGLVRPPVIGIGQPGDVPPPRARVSQVSLLLTANVLGQANAALLKLTANLQLGAAEADLLSLNCAARLGSDTLATFEAATAPVELALRVGLVDSRANVAPVDLNRVSIAGSRRQVSIRLDQFRQPVVIPNPLTLTSMVRNLGDVVEAMRLDLVSQVNKNSCEAGLVSLLLCPLFTVVNATVAALMSVLSNIANGLAWLLGTLGMNAIVQAVLDLLGIGVAQAELILDDYSCRSALIR